MSYAAIFACSHRKGGNTDHAAELMAQGVMDAGGKARVFFVRDYAVEHCLACGACEKAAGQPPEKCCVLSPRDDSMKLFRPLLEARTVLISSPIYFYALPSRFTTLMDRSQQFWAARNRGESWLVDQPARTATLAMAAGRPRGEKLFEGAERSLRFFLKDYGIEIAQSLHFRGKDGPNDMRADESARERLLRAGREAWTGPES